MENSFPANQTADDSTKPKAIAPAPSPKRMLSEINRVNADLDNAMPDSPDPIKTVPAIRTKRFPFLPARTPNTG